MNKKLQKIADSYFKIYPQKDKLFVTEDGNVFLEQSPAVDHANKTNQKWFIADNPARMKTIEKAEDEKKEAEIKLKLEEAEIKLKTLDFEQVDYHEVYDLATDLQLPLTDKKKKTVMEALVKKQK